MYVSAWRHLPAHHFDMSYVKRKQLGVEMATTDDAVERSMLELRGFHAIANCDLGRLWLFADTSTRCQQTTNEQLMLSHNWDSPNIATIEQKAVPSSRSTQSRLDMDCRWDIVTNMPTETMRPKVHLKIAYIGLLRIVDSLETYEHSPSIQITLVHVKMCNPPTTA
jgi:hypothetical protein